MSDNLTPTPFEEYTVDVAGVGTCTVIDPAGEPGYRYRLPDGQVSACAAQSGDPCPANAAADIAYAIANPRTPALSEAQIWEQKLAGSITDAETGLALKANRSARNDFIGQDVLLKKALDAGILQPTDPCTIWDAFNVAHELSVTDVRALLLRYGIAWNAMFQEYAP